MNIGDAAKAAGVSPKMIRHYEQTGLLPEAERSESGYRLYGKREVSVLRFIRQSRRLGFSMPQIAELIGQWGDSHRTSLQVKTIALRHLSYLEEKLQEIAEMKAGLEQLIDACAGNDHSHCAIIETLASQSPEAPRHEARFVKPKRRHGSGDYTNRPVKPQPSTGHVDLMAWMRGAHPHDH
ncbi:MerR family transcriptional regulator [Hylemonella gracilis str. Niagara R]|uniref:MerR family transcriptional regulator n=2 Tax=Hylemonella gracilis TaxID=80880 RepID=A0A016XN59_9BURK|nr:MerR family transcriptional regulator [Hylemonella gracilis str. Niagara R]